MNLTTLSQTAIDRAIAAMPEYIVEPTLTLPGRWYVQNRSELHRAYVVDARPGRQRCTCPAGERGQACRHLVMVAEAIREEEEAMSRAEYLDALEHYHYRPR